VYPSIVVGDSLRDSLGALQPIRAFGLNYKGEPVADAAIVFSSPDTNLRVFSSGTVYARSRKTDGLPARLFATAGSLQSQPDSIFTVPRGDSIKAVVEADTAFGASLSDADLLFTVFGDTVPKRPKLIVPGWLVSFRVRYHGVELAPTDTTVAFPCRVTTGRILSNVDTTDASGRAGRRLCLKGAPRSPVDTAFLIATSRQRKAGTDPISTEMRLLFLPEQSSPTRVASP
jgi:hypothetical protein